VLCKVGACVEVTAGGPEKACVGTPIQISGSVKNCSGDPETIVVRLGDRTVEIGSVPAGESRNYSFDVTMPACQGNGRASFTVTAEASNDCGTATKTAAATVACSVPQIDVEKTAESTVDPGGTIHYVITLTNPSADVALTNLEVRDALCSYVRYAGNASPAPASQPAVGSTGEIVWRFDSLAPGASVTITFEATAVGNADPCTEDVTCVNTVTATGYCGEAQARDEASASTLIPCPQPGLCRFTGGGCLNENGNQKGHKQHTFGGNVSPQHDGGGPTGNSWEHVVRDGRTVLFNFHSWDPYVFECSVVPPGPCSPKAENTRADFRGPGKYSLGAGSRERDAYFVAHIIDHREGSCNKDTRDDYAITVWDAETNEVVFEFKEQQIDCGNFQIHETPSRLFGGSATAQQPTVGSVESVALLNRAVPNPFSATTSFAYRVPEGGAAVEIGVYNVAGRLVKTLAAGSQESGQYTVTWNGTDEAGIRMAAGVYFLKSRVGVETSTTRVIYVAR
jgi:uncharacterized repeat protein (TIGR01451 family)